MFRVAEDVFSKGFYKCLPAWSDNFADARTFLDKTELIQKTVERNLGHTFEPSKKTPPDSFISNNALQRVFWNVASIVAVCIADVLD